MALAFLSFQPSHLVLTLSFAIKPACQSRLLQNALSELHHTSFTVNEPHLSSWPVTLLLSHPHLSYSYSPSCASPPTDSFSFLLDLLLAYRQLTFSVLPLSLHLCC